MLSLKNIDVFYGKVQVLFDVSLEVEKETICALFGRNGAGKTTLLESCVGILPITRGSVEFKGKSITNMEPYRICSRGVGFVFQERSVFPTLSIMEHLALATVNAFDGKSLQELLEETIELFPDLKPHVKDKGATLSGGEGRMLQLALALARRPAMLLLDEPLAGLSAKNVHRFMNRLSELKRQITVFVAEQNIRTALEISDSYYILKEGSLVYQNTVKNIDESEKVVKDYILGS